MFTVALSIGLLDALMGLFLFKSTFQSDDRNSPARLGALAMATLMVSSAILLVALVI